MHVTRAGSFGVALALSWGLALYALYLFSLDLAVRFGFTGDLPLVDTMIASVGYIPLWQEMVVGLHVAIATAVLASMRSKRAVLTGAVACAALIVDWLALTLIISITFDPYAGIIPVSYALLVGLLFILRAEKVLR